MPSPPRDAVTVLLCGDRPNNPPHQREGLTHDAFLEVLGCEAELIGNVRHHFMERHANNPRANAMDWRMSSRALCFVPRIWLTLPNRFGNRPRAMSRDVESKFL